MGDDPKLISCAWCVVTVFLHRQAGPHLLTEDAEAVNRLSLSDVMADGPDLNGNGVRFPATGHPERFALTLYDAPAKLNSATRPPHDGTTGAPFRSANSPRGRTAAIGTAHDAGTTTGRAYTPPRAAAPPP